MADGGISEFLGQFFNIRPAEQGGGWDGRGRVDGREVDKLPYRHFASHPAVCLMF